MDKAGLTLASFTGAGEPEEKMAKKLTRKSQLPVPVAKAGKSDDKKSDDMKYAVAKAA